MNISNIPSIRPSELHPDTTPAEIAERQRVVHAVHVLNQGNLFGENRELTFVLDRNTHRIVIHVIDRDTRETVMQLPPEYILRLAAQVKQAP